MKGQGRRVTASAVAFVAIVVLFAGAVILVSRTLGGETGGPSNDSSSSGCLCLKVGDYAQFTGEGTFETLSENETARFQVVGINSSGVEWMQSSTINGQSSDLTWVVPDGVSPFHFPHANDTFVFVKSYSGSQLIGSQGYHVTISVYTENGNYTNTYYYLQGTSLIPIEFTGQTNSAASPVIMESFYLTSTDIPRLTTVNPTR